MYTAMIVDDEYPARNMLELLIDWQENDFQIIAKAENGKQALALYEKEKPDLIITDIQMPVMDGIELIEEIRKRNPDQYIVVLSCHESFRYAQQAIRLGVKDYLIKDMLTESQLENCLSHTAQHLEKTSESLPEKQKLVFSREPDETIRQAYPTWLAKSENRMNLLQNSLLANDYDGAQKYIQKLYQVPFEGLVRFHFLDWVNKFVYQLLRDQCEKQNIPADQIFGKYEHQEKELLIEAETEDSCCQLLCLFVQRFKTLNVSPESFSVRIQNVIKYIQENYYYDISLQSVADHFGVHKVYLSRSFKAETGDTLNEFLNKTRIEKAKLLLSITENQTREISYTVGFNNTQSFYNVFKKYEGCSPNEYRREHCKH